jgi:hypothetical protein
MSVGVILFLIIFLDKKAVKKSRPKGKKSCEILTISTFMLIVDSVCFGVSLQKLAF